MSMTKEEYFAKKRSINRALDEEFAKSNNTVEVGDKIRDSVGWGIVNKISVMESFGGRPPQMIYRCDNLTKAGKIRKINPMRTIWQRNLM